MSFMDYTIKSIIPSLVSPLAHLIFTGFTWTLAVPGYSFFSQFVVTPFGTVFLFSCLTRCILSFL